MGFHLCEAKKKTSVLIKICIYMFFLDPFYSLPALQIIIEIRLCDIELCGFGCALAKEV